MDILLAGLFLFNLSAGALLILFKIERIDQVQAERAKEAREETSPFGRHHNR